MKYKSSDIEKMIDVFAEISNNGNNPDRVVEELKKLINYPVNVLQEFMHCMEILEGKNKNYLKENYWGIVGYITLRLNFVK